MELREALRIIQDAAGHWAEYLEENDRDTEIEPIDAANDVLDQFVKLIDG